MLQPRSAHGRAATALSQQAGMGEFVGPEVPRCVPGTVAVPGCGSSPAQRCFHGEFTEAKVKIPGLPSNLSLPGFRLPQAPETPIPALSRLPSSRRGQQIAPLEGGESRSGEHEVSIWGCFAVLLWESSVRIILCCSQGLAATKMFGSVPTRSSQNRAF